MFIYHNENPNHELVGDCVVRAIAFALDIDYDYVLQELFKVSNYFNCDMIVKDCYNILLSEKYELPMFYGNGNSVEKIAKDFRDKILIMRIDGHLTCSKYGNIFDVWDTSKEIVDVFWIVED